MVFGLLRHISSNLKVIFLSIIRPRQFIFVRLCPGSRWWINFLFLLNYLLLLHVDWGLSFDIWCLWLVQHLEDLHRFYNLLDLIFWYASLDPHSAISIRNSAELLNLRSALLDVLCDFHGVHHLMLFHLLFLNSILGYVAEWPWPRLSDWLFQYPVHRGNRPYLFSLNYLVWHFYKVVSNHLGLSLLGQFCQGLWSTLERFLCLRHVALIFLLGPIDVVKWIWVGQKWALRLHQVLQLHEGLARPKVVWQVNEFSLCQSLEVHLQG